MENEINLNGQVYVLKSELEEIRKIFIEVKALDYSQKQAEKLVNQAKYVISGMKISKKHKNLLNQMADFLVKREK